MSKFGKYLRDRAIDPLLGFLKQGMSPEKLALTVCFGFIWGIFPILGTSTILCIVTAFVFRLNHAAIQIVNYVVYPLQFILLIPFLQGGVWLSGSTVLEYDIDELIGLFTNNLLGAISELGSVLVFGIVAWMIFSIPLFLIAYYILLRLFRKITASAASH